MCLCAVHKQYSTVLSSVLLMLSDPCWPLAVGAQEYMKLSDVFKMYGSSGRRQSSTSTSHGGSFAIDAALAGACEVPSLLSVSSLIRYCLDSVCLSLYLSLSLSLSLCLSPSFHFHVMLLPLLVCCESD